jgi:mismatch-specific thymine-DNA glycosylase
MTDNSIAIVVNGREVRTLRDLLPEKSGLRALFVGKTPALVSVEAGHYFQGTQGRAFWGRLREYGILRPTTNYEDDSLVAQGFGLTDIVKVPRNYGNEPSEAEYRAGMDRILELITVHRPRVVVFVYKGVLDKVLKLKYGVTKKAVYGINADAEAKFGAPVFAFPLPGVGSCTRAQAAEAMRDLKELLRDGQSRLHPQKCDGED